MSDAQDGLIEQARQHLSELPDTASQGASAWMIRNLIAALAAQAAEIADLKATLAAEVKTSSHLAKAIEELRAELAAAREYMRPVDLAAAIDAARAR